MLALRALELRATRITDEGLLNCLPEMPQLHELNLGYLDITDKGLGAIGSLSWLERLNLRHTAVSNDAIIRLVNEKAHTLIRLNLSNTVVIDAALAEFPEQSRLQSLSLLDTGITDEGVRHVAGANENCRARTEAFAKTANFAATGLPRIPDLRHRPVSCCNCDLRRSAAATHV